MPKAEHITTAISAAAVAVSLAVLLKQRRRDRRGSDAEPLEEPGSPRLSKAEAHDARLDELNTLVLERGSANTTDYRVHVLTPRAAGRSGSTKELSLWHDVPLVAADGAPASSTPTFNFVCEIPKCTRKKFEVATNEHVTPIKQDTKKGVLREFKKGDIFFNYGCFPRTWEDPRHTSPDTGYPGDNDPLDVCEIGLRQVRTGEIRAVKVLGVLAMIDDDETDWKVVAIDAEDRWASELNDVDDVERLLPGTVGLIREWFRTYKIPDGKPPNKFAFEERCLPAAYALKVIHETHESYLELIKEGKGHEDLHAPVAYDAALPARVSA
ncbi:inorganic diphosphatase [Aureococcus anophagefferens]|nr:inorganic diphosphatase [Aureococcus anophagefferens]